MDVGENAGKWERVPRTVEDPPEKERYIPTGEPPLAKEPPPSLQACHWRDKQQKTDSRQRKGKVIEEDDKEESEATARPRPNWRERANLKDREDERKVWSIM